MTCKPSVSGPPALTEEGTAGLKCRGRVSNQGGEEATKVSPPLRLCNQLHSAPHPCTTFPPEAEDSRDALGGRGGPSNATFNSARPHRPTGGKSDAHVLEAVFKRSMARGRGRQGLAFVVSPMGALTSR